jgi:hypothetical protein
MLRYFGTSIFITVASIVLAGWQLGLGAVFTIIVLIAIEIAFSFDNAVINAKILERLSKVWQQLFLTIGMVVAIVGMRFVFPILIVMVTADLPWGKVIDDALNHPKVYAEHLEHAHAAISAFGGAFLMTLTFYFLFDDAREVLWLKRLERNLQKAGGNVWLPPLLVAILVGLASLFAGHDSGTVLRAGLAGVISYTAIHLLIEALGRIAPKGQKLYTGWAAFLAFMYLQILDASFSFDGVLGAFAITDQVLLIVLGLGVGAIWVRSLTVYLVRKRTLNAYKYLEHGAHYAIFVLAAALLGSIFIAVPDAITGIVGIGVIAASFVSSLEAKRAKERAA